MLMELNIENGSSFIADLITIGRVTGKRHTVKLRLVFYDGRFYASRKSTDGDWLKNILVNPSVIVEIDGMQIECNAKPVENEELSRKISELKYSDERREENRAVIEITPIKYNLHAERN